MVQNLPAALGYFNITKVFLFYHEKGVTKDGFELKEVKEELILKKLLKLDPTKSTGMDKLPAKFILDSAHIISTPFTFIVNLSIATAQIPQDFKTARVIPLHKKNSKLEAGNYRPVSILVILSKTLERVIYDQLEAYLNSKNLLYQFQSGFRSSFSTDTCLIHLTDYIKKEMDNGNITGMVLLDLQKAFDTVDHDIMCNKLSAIGSNDKTVSWFKSYLTGRSQMVRVNNVDSSDREITCGVPQGSILGPLLFLIYVNDMEMAVKCKLLLYADDSALLVSGKEIDVIQKELSNNLQSVHHWLVDNKLSLHLGKTEAILFGSKRKIKNAKIEVTCNSIPIKQQASVKYLGMTIDQNLSGDKVANSVISKCNGRLKFLYRNKQCLDRNARKTLCNALIQSHFDYACSCWYTSLTVKLKNKLQVCQNKMVRFILSMDARSHVGAHEITRINWVDVESRVKFLKLNHMFKILHNKAPKYMQKDFENCQKSHRYNTRSSQLSYDVPQFKSTGQTTFMYSGIKIWNDIPPFIQNASTINNYKKLVKSHLKNQMHLIESNLYVYG